MKIYSYNVMGQENRRVIQSTIQELVATSGNFVLCVQEAGLASSYIFPETEGMHIVALAAMDAVHKPNMLTASSSADPKQHEIILFPRLTSIIWKVLFRLFYRSEVPQHTAIITYHELPNGDELAVANVHFDVLGGIRLKTKQIKMIKESLESRNIERVVIVGDYNITSVEKVIELCLVLGDGFSVVGDPIAITSNIRHTMSNVVFGRWFHPILRALNLTHLFDCRRDWIIAKNVDVSEKVLTEHKGSDHYPVLYEIE